MNKIKKLLSIIRNHFAYTLDASFGQPELFYLKITERCNLACQNCDIWKSTDQQELTLQQWQLIISKIKVVSPNANIIISGGEPFLNSNFWPLIKFIKDNNLTITINTNGSLLTDEVIEKLKALNVDKIEISLYSLDKETLEKIRGSQLAGQALLAVERLIKHGMNKQIVIAWLLNRFNLEETVSAVEHFSNQNIWMSLQPLDTNVQAMNQIGHSSISIKENKLWPTDKEIITNTFNQIISLKKSGNLIYNRISQLEFIKGYYLENFDQIINLPCYCGIKNFIISSQGNVHFCFSGPSIGNIINQSVAEIWQSKQAQGVRKQNKQCQKTCRIMNCNYQPSLTKMVKEYIIKQVSSNKIDN